MKPETKKKKKMKVKCPTCGTSIEWEKSPFRPFCSERCRTQDRASWADEAYTLPHDSSPSAEDLTD